MHLALLLVVAAQVAAQVDGELYEPTPRPSARRPSTIAVQPLADREQLYVYGGFASGFFGDLWRFDTQALTWAEVDDGATTPGVRDIAMLAWDDVAQRVILFGGFRTEGFVNHQHLNDVWAFDPTASSWTQLTPSGTPPAPRSSALFQYVPDRGDFVLFGGWDIKPRFPAGTTGCAPATTPGCGTKGHFHDLWRLAISGTTATWTLVSSGQTGPAARAASCFAYDEARRNIVMFGGQLGLDAQDNGIDDNDTWALDVDTLGWTSVTATDPPSPRSFCSAAFDPGADRMMFYGGQQGPAILDGMFTYDPATAAWQQETVDVVVGDQGRLCDHGAGFSPSLGAMVTFGGRISGGGASVYTDDTYTFDLQTGGPPIADAGEDQTVDEGTLVQVDGTLSSDPDGAPLSFSWRQIAGTAVSLSDPSSAAPTFTAPTLIADDTLTFELTVNDGLASATDVVLVFVIDAFNDPPTADAGPDDVVVEGALVTLDGSASSDPDPGDALGFSWVQVAGPAVVLDDPTNPAPRFVAPSAPATLMFSLVVDDGMVASAADFVEITVTNAANAPPVAAAGADFDAAPGIDVSLDGSGSFDPNGAPLLYTWTQTAGPAVVLDDGAAVAPTLSTPVSLAALTVTFQLVVSDGVFLSAPDLVDVTVRPNLGAPRIASIARRIAVVATPYQYDDDDSVEATGSATTYALVSGPPGMTVDAVSGLVSWMPDVPGTVTVEVAAQNAEGDAVQAFNVEVFSPPVITSTPTTIFSLGSVYRYDDDGAPSASGSGPIAWELIEGPAGMVVDVETGAVTWVTLFPDAVTVRIAAVNAFGRDEQVFELARPPDTIPRIQRTANPFAAVGRPYIFDLDRQVGIDNVLPGDVLLVAPIPPTPDGFLVVTTDRHVVWRPQSPGRYSVQLALVSASGVSLDSYEFDVEVLELGADLATAVNAATPTSGAAPLTVQFDASGSRGSAGAPIFINYWDTGAGAAVGDLVELGGTAQPTATYTYATPGSYTAELEVWDAYGVFASDKVTISVADGGRRPPTARIQMDVVEGQDQLTVQFGCDCADEDGSVSGVLWSYGDGSTASFESPTHTYVAPGNYRVRLTVFDDDGLTGTDTAEVRVRAGDLLAPSARIAATPAEGDQPMNVQLEADVGDDDGVVVDVRWALPDGTVRTGPRVEHTFVTPGYYPVLLEAVDNDGLVGRDVLTIAVRADGIRAPRIVSTPASLVAVAGDPWRYDEDGRASAQGGRPLVWRLGKVVGGERVNAPAGMSVAVDGALAWTPAAAQVGEQRISLVVENGVGADLQEFTVLVQPGALSGTAGCGCGAADPSSVLPIALFAGLLCCRRRRTREASLALFALLALAAPAALAAPSFLSTPPTSAVVGDVYVYDVQASGDGLVDLALLSGPAGVVLDNVGGQLRFVPTVAGTFELVLAAVDRTGVAEQRFALEAQGGVPARFDFTAPAGGFVFRTDEFGTIAPDAFVIPAVGDLPMQFFAINGANCTFVLANGAAMFHRGEASVCSPTLRVVNPWGSETRTIDVTFVAPADAERLFRPVLTATPSEGAAPHLVVFDGTTSGMPADQVGWVVAANLTTGDGGGVVFGGDPSGYVFEHVYTRPGTFEASLTIVASDALMSAITIVERHNITIVVADEGNQPPTGALTVDAASGVAPHTVAFSSQVIPSDAPIVMYTLEFGDGDRFEVAQSSSGAFEVPSAPRHVYASAGHYLPRLTVVDAVGRSGTAEAEVLVADAAGSPPTVRILAFPARGEVPLTVNLDAERADIDGTIARSTWILPGGGLSNEAATSIVLEQPGDHVVELVVADDDGLETRARAVLAATRNGALPPRVVSTPNLRADAGVPWRYDDDSTLTVVGGGPYRFALGKLLGGTLRNAPEGMSIDESTGLLAWTPAPDATGEVPISILVENAAGATLHELVVVVAPARPALAPSPVPQSCGAGGPPALAALLVLIGGRRRRARHSARR